MTETTMRRLGEISPSPPKSVTNPYLSLLLYFVGLIGVLIIGYLLQIYILPKIKKTEL